VLAVVVRCCCLPLLSQPVRGQEGNHVRERREQRENPRQGLGRCTVASRTAGAGTEKGDRKCGRRDGGEGQAEPGRPDTSARFEPEVAGGQPLVGDEDADGEERQRDRQLRGTAAEDGDRERQPGDDEGEARDREHSPRYHPNVGDEL